MAVSQNAIQVIERVIGNTEAIGITIQDFDGTAINLTGSTWQVEIVDMSDHSVLATRSASIVTAASGTITFTPDSTDVDAVGRFALYAIDDSTPVRRHPYDGARLQLNVKQAGNE